MTVWIKLRTGSFVLYASCHRPIRNAWCAWWELEVVACTFRIPNEEPISWLSWPEKDFITDFSRLEFWILSYLLPEDRLWLTTETLLFAIVTSSSLGEFRLLGFLILSHLELFMMITFWTVGPSSFGNIHLKITKKLCQFFQKKQSFFDNWFWKWKIRRLYYSKDQLSGVKWNFPSVLNTLVFENGWQSLGLSRFLEILIPHSPFSQNSKSEKEVATADDLFIPRNLSPRSEVTKI